MLGPFLPLCRRLGRLATSLAESSSIDRVEVQFLGRIAERDTRPLATAVLLGVLSGRVEEEVNAVNAPSLAAERGIELVEITNVAVRDFTDLVRVRVVAGDRDELVAGTMLGRTARQSLLQAWGERFDLQLVEHLTLFRYDDVPGMIGRVGTILGGGDVNISGMYVGRLAPRERAMMVLTLDDVPTPDLLALIEAEGDIERAVSVVL
jgi:D-3-phosphoglycerate dehydrogenase